MNILIDNIKNTSFSYGDVVSLIRQSFEERLRQGLVFTCSSMSVDDFMNRTRESTVLVAIDKDSNRLLGTGTISLLKDNRGVLYGYIEYAAIAPDLKRCGIGSKLLAAREKIAIDMGAKYILSDTAVGADSSIKYHKKNGYRIIQLMHYPTTNYYSYVFRKDFTPVRSFRLCEKIVLLRSIIVVRLIFRRNGSYSLFYNFIKKVKMLCIR